MTYCGVVGVHETLIRFEDVSFAYVSDPAEEWEVLSEINLEIKKVSSSLYWVIMAPENQLWLNI